MLTVFFCQVAHLKLLAHFGLAERCQPDDGER